MVDGKKEKGESYLCIYYVICEREMKNFRLVLSRGLLLYIVCFSSCFNYAPRFRLWFPRKKFPVNLQAVRRRGKSPSSFRVVQQVCSHSSNLIRKVWPELHNLAILPLHAHNDKARKRVFLSPTWIIYQNFLPLGGESFRFMYVHNIFVASTPFSIHLQGKINKLRTQIPNTLYSRYQNLESSVRRKMCLFRFTKRKYCTRSLYKLESDYLLNVCNHMPAMLVGAKKALLLPRHSKFIYSKFLLRCRIIKFIMKT